MVRGGKPKKNNYKIVDDTVREKKSEDNKRKCRRYYLNTIQNNIIRLAETNANKFKSFITLTYSKDVSEEENTKYLNLLFTKLRKHYRDLSYIWALERTKRGRLHVHLLTSLEFPECTATSKERKTEEHKMIEQQFEKLWTYKSNVLGWCDIRTIKDDLSKYSLYLAKYITKDKDDVVTTNKHIYGYSKNTLDKPIQEAYLTDKSLEEILKGYAGYDIKYSGNYEIEYAFDKYAKVRYFNIYKEKDK